MRRQKVRVDKSNVWYVIVGGESWHGINKDIFDEVEAKATESRLVVALRVNGAFQMFMGDLGTLIHNKDSLTYSSQDQYQFHVELVGNKLSLSELPAYSLSRFDLL